MTAESRRSWESSLPAGPLRRSFSEASRQGCSELAPLAGTSGPARTRSLAGRGGQALILLVVLMGGMLMMATAIAGLLMYYQLQQSNDAGRSTEAIFAADAGLEKASHFYWYDITPVMQAEIESGACWDQPCTSSTLAFGLLGTDSNGVPDSRLPNGATFQTELIIPPTDAAGDISLSASGQDSGARTIRSVRTTYFRAPPGTPP